MGVCGRSDQQVRESALWPSSFAYGGGNDESVAAHDGRRRDILTRDEGAPTGSNGAQLGHRFAVARYGVAEGAPDGWLWDSPQGRPQTKAH
jgi:hypothetical protein